MTRGEAAEAARIAVVLGHRQSLMRAALASVVTKHGFEVAGTADTVEAVRAMAVELHPDVILLDWRLDDAVIDTVSELISGGIVAGVALLLELDDAETVMPALEAGVNGFLSTGMEEESLADALRLISRGEVVISREMAAAIAHGSKTSHEPLTEREIQVLGMVGQGATNREISESLVITENTVKVHLRNILDKLNLKNRQQAAAYAAEHGIKADPLFLDEGPQGLAES